MARTQPNIVITGTPGTGKTTHCTALAEATGLAHMDINKIVKDHDCSAGYDTELGSTIVDEDKLLDAVEPILKKGGAIVDWHACDLWPAQLVDLVVVVRCRTEELYDRYKTRGYGDRKVEENMDAEIMEVLLEEAREAYDERCVVEVRSDVVEDVEGNVERLERWVEAWKGDHPDGVGEEVEEED
ncbi:POS9-activating factor FAP7 [Myriangium duriaei CBS 260.36]|uniref:Adenylate kinase isoenzyme 6 homolog n=1 Tax=Myriangium duriaei CBS 260.36 TaxID=1168546 RepID=A0A9P4JAY2_9PEZI|nr:POS9-activating factor FAP7 [Myriangium duriaei CBS 260.36]